MNRFKCYMISVLAYYRAEWTEVSDQDDGYRLLVTKDLQSLIRGCFRRKTSVPNAAKEVEIFIDLESHRSKGGGCSENEIDSDAKP